ncbi:MAG: hypothetical protein K2K03_02510 [Prevotella sp.]|nr:hypothetical protein [Prevotella sp.]
MCKAYRYWCAQWVRTWCGVRRRMMRTALLSCADALGTMHGRTPHYVRIRSARSADVLGTVGWPLRHA